MGALSLGPWTGVILKPLAPDPHARWAAHRSAGLLGFLALPGDDLGKAMAASNLAGMSVCDTCMGRIAIVLRMEFELTGFTHYLDYDFLGLT